MKKGLSKIIAIVDRSGSMSCIKRDAIGGFNTFLEGQQKEKGDADLTLVLFDTEYLTPEKSVNIDKVKPLDESTFVPRGGTALYDAIGKSIIECQEEIKAMKESEKPEQVIIAILTDGDENASREFTCETIKVMIEEAQKESDWGFVFLAANQDASLAGQSIGIKAGHTMSFAHTTRGATKAYDTMTNLVGAYRGGGDKSVMYAANMTTMTDELDDQGGNTEGAPE